MQDSIFNDHFPKSSLRSETLRLYVAEAGMRQTLGAVSRPARSAEHERRIAGDAGAVLSSFHGACFPKEPSSESDSRCSSRCHHSTPGELRSSKRWELRWERRCSDIWGLEMDRSRRSSSKRGERGSSGMSETISLLTPGKRAVRRARFSCLI